jgi:hypothetical protein
MGLLLLSLALAACGNATATRSPEATPGATSTPATQPSSTPRSSAETPSSSGSARPGGSPAPSPVGSPAGGGATACSGTAENRDFFASIAAAVDWTVYCPVLADGWFVQDGQYRLADGGRLQIVYQGPDRARITLDEGAFCTISGGCVAPGVDIGPTAFGDRTGTLVALDDGSWAVAVDRESTLSWIMVVTGLDEAATRKIAATMVTVGG